MIKKYWKVLLVLIIIIAAGIVYFNFYTENETTNQKEIDPRMVMEVKKGSLRKTISVEGFIEPINTEDLTFPAKSSGSIKVKDIYINEGDRVEEGQLLMELDETETRLNYIQRQNAYNRAKINGSKNEIEEARLNFELSKDNLENLKLKAPFSGIVTDIYIEKGSYYISGSAATIKDISSLQVEINIDESDISTVELGQKVILTLSSLPGIELNGIVNELGNEADNNNSVVTLPVKVLIDKTDQPIKLGVSASLDIIIGQVKNKVVLPITAIVNINGKDLVVKVVDGKTERAPVQTGLSDGLNIVIESGLEIGDNILLNTYQQVPGYGQGNQGGIPGAVFMGGGRR